MLKIRERLANAWSNFKKNPDENQNERKSNKTQPKSKQPSGKSDWREHGSFAKFRKLPFPTESDYLLTVAYVNDVVIANPMNRLLVEPLKRVNFAIKRWVYFWSLVPALVLWLLSIGFSKLFVQYNDFGVAVQMFDPAGAKPYILATAVIGLSIGYFKARDEMIYYVMLMTGFKHDLNRQTLAAYKRSEQESRIQELERQRARWNDRIMFPSVKEYASLYQDYHLWLNMAECHRRENTIRRYQDRSFENIRKEHIAAKQIAEIKRKRNGEDPNQPDEYDKMVDKYASRTMPEVHDIITDMKRLNIAQAQKRKSVMASRQAN